MSNWTLCTNGGELIRSKGTAEPGRVVAKAVAWSAQRKVVFRIDALSSIERMHCQVPGVVKFHNPRFADIVRMCCTDAEAKLEVFRKISHGTWGKCCERTDSMSYDTIPNMMCT